MIKTALKIILLSLTSLALSFEDDFENINRTQTTPTIIKTINSNTLGSLIKRLYLGKSVLVEKPDRSSDVSLVEITISLSSQRSSPYICAADGDYVVICRKLKGGIITDIYSTNNIIIHDNKFCERNLQCSESEALED